MEIAIKVKMIKLLKILCNTGLDSKNLNIKLIKNAKMSAAIAIDTEPVTISHMGMKRFAGQSSLNRPPMIIMANG